MYTYIPPYISMSFLDESVKTHIAKSIAELTPEREFEVSFNPRIMRKTETGDVPSEPLLLTQFLNVIEYLKKRELIGKSSTSDGNSVKLTKEESIDMSVQALMNDTTTESLRLTLMGKEFSNKTLGPMAQLSNSIIFSTLFQKTQKTPSDNITFIKKIKNKSDILDIPMHNLRIRNSIETSLSKKDKELILNVSELHKLAIVFRYKQRVSLVLVDDDNVTIRIDATIVKQNPSLIKLKQSADVYELELECIAKKEIGSKASAKYQSIIIDEIDKLVKVIQQSREVLSDQDKTDILSRYHLLMYGSSEITTKFTYKMNAVSLEKQHIVEYLPNRYAVSDKADGEGMSLFVYKNKAYMLSGNLEVIATGMDVDPVYNDTILDGENIFIKERNKTLYLVFDTLFYKATDVRENANLMERLAMADDVLKFGFKLNYMPQHNTKPEIQTNYDKLDAFYTSEFQKYFDDLNGELNKGSKPLVLRRKYFLPVMGLKDHEVFALSTIMYKAYTNNSSLSCPYKIDGLIYTPLVQKYTRDQSQIKYQIYKWKPPNKNTIDFYLTIKRNRETNEVQNVFDNTRNTTEADEQGVTNELVDKVYRIGYLHVGQVVGGKEKPVLFQKESNGYVCHLFVKDGEIRDVEGNVIKDNTVVEFYYNSDFALPNEERWIPLRTRFDKTESVIKYGRKYGNNIQIATKIWNSIRNPITENDIYQLGNESTFESQFRKIRTQIDAKVVAIEQSQNAYYQLRNNMGKNMREFHNWIKSNMIYTYASPQKNKRLKILDYGVGRGGDFMKFFHSRVKMLVGIDIDENGINSTTDGAISRYNNVRSKFPEFPPMYFAVADGANLLNYESQKPIVGRLGDHNKRIIERFFGTDESSKFETMFDVVNCQFVLHYFMKSELAFDNFCGNLNRYLDKNGFLLVTTFDGQSVHQLLSTPHEHMKDGTYRSEYTLTDGTLVKFFELVKQYNTTDIKQFGLTVDVHIASYMDDQRYEPEYLVDKDFLIELLEKKAKMKLVETDTFDHVFAMHKKYFTEVVPKEDDPHTLKFLTNVGKFYNMDDSENRASFEMSRLYRYYVFQKHE